MQNKKNKLKPVSSISIHNCQSWRNVCTRLTFMAAMTAMGIKQAASPRPPTGQINSSSISECCSSSNRHQKCCNEAFTIANELITTTSAQHMPRPYRGNCNCNGRLASLPACLLACLAVQLLAVGDCASGSNLLH